MEIGGAHRIRAFGLWLGAVLVEGARRLLRRSGIAALRRRWALLMALAAGGLVWLLLPALLLRTIGGDCRTHWEFASTGPLSEGDGLQLDPGSCPLSHPERIAVWIVAAVAALVIGLIATRIVRVRGGHDAA